MVYDFWHPWKCRLFNFKQKIPYFHLQWYYCVTNLQTHAHTDKNHGRMLFPCALHAVQPRHVRHFWFRVSQFASSHRFWNKNYGLSMWRPRPRYEWRFVKHQRTDDLPQSVLTVDSHCQSTCKVRVQPSVSLAFHAVQNFLLPDIWFVRIRDFLAVKICTAIS